MKRNYVALDVDDPRSSLIAEILANKSCKKILGLLAERDLSESELASELGIPLTTVGYNVKKLIGAGLIERKRSLWSSRGKMVPTYHVSNKSIVISPRKLSQNVIPALIISGLIALVVSYWYPVEQPLNQGAYDTMSEIAAVSAPAARVASTSTVFVDAALWFFIGAVTFSVVYILLSKLRAFR